MTEPGTVPIRETFAAFYLREFPKLVALAAAVSGNRAVAEDLAQEALVRAHRRWDAISAYEKPGAWARRVTINLAVSTVRRRAAEARRAARLGFSTGTVPPPAPEDERIWDEVGRLPRKQRAAIALHYLEDRSVRDIAEILQCSESTAKVHLHKGRRSLATALADHRGEA